jgi:endo-1,4-beta-xylanase
MKTAKLLTSLAIALCLLLVPLSCAETPPPQTPSPAAEELSARIVAVDIDETTALTSLFRISEELDQAQSEGSLHEGEWTELQAELMAEFTDWVNTREERLGLANLPAAPTGNISWPAQDNALLEGADERIEQYRQGDAIITVVDASGAPVADAVVRLDMLKHDFLFGANLFALQAGGQSYGDAFARLLNYATLPFYWPGYEGVRGQESEAGLKSMAIWASDHGITTKGHPLVWPANSAPPWAALFSPEELDEVQHERVTRIVNNFRGLINYWDVVNEPTNVDSYQEPLRSWALAYTPAAATARALEWARASNQGATLLVNDWRNDAGYHTILEDVMAFGVRFDAIGLQSHMHMGTWTLQQVWDICERFKDFNLPLHFTEVTVLSGHLKTDNDWSSYHPGWDTTPEGEALQAEYVAGLYTILFSHPSLQAITWWDLSDLNAWQGAPAGLLRKDMTPKPAYEQLMRLIHKEWWTNAEATTNEQGEALIRGFYGQYLLTIESGAQTVQKLIHLEAGKDNIFEMRLP